MQAHHKDGSTTILNRLKPEAEPSWSDEERLDLLKNLGFSEHGLFKFKFNLDFIVNYWIDNSWQLTN